VQADRQTASISTLNQFDQPVKAGRRSGVDCSTVCLAKAQRSKAGGRATTLSLCCSSLSLSPFSSSEDSNDWSFPLAITHSPYPQPPTTHKLPTTPCDPLTNLSTANTTRYRLTPLVHHPIHLSTPLAARCVNRARLRRRYLQFSPVTSDQPSTPIIEESQQALEVLAQFASK